MAEDKLINWDKVLPASTAEKYELVKDKVSFRNSTKVFYQKYGFVDFATLSVSRAAQLVAKKADFIVEKITKSTTSTTANAKGTN